MIEKSEVFQTFKTHGKYDVSLHCFLTKKVSFVPFRDTNDTYQIRDENNRLFTLVHLFVVLFIITTSDVIHPLLVIQIPLNSLLYTLFKLKAWFPTQFSL